MHSMPTFNKLLYTLGIICMLSFRYVLIFVFVYRNYGPSILIQGHATAKGCDQVLWLCGDDHQVSVCHCQLVMCFPHRSQKWAQ